MPRDDHLAEVNQLRRAAERCIVTLGSGLLLHPANDALRERFRDSSLDESQFYRQLQLRLLQIAAWHLGETLSVIPAGADRAKAQYLETYSVTALSKPEQPKLTDAASWQRLSRVLLALWQGDDEIAIAGWGSALFDPAAVSDLVNTELDDEYVRSVLLTVSKEILVNSKPDNGTDPLDFQVLGRIHEWLLELHAVISRHDWRLELETLPGHERRATGSYFTPEDLVENLLDLTLEPVLDERTLNRDSKIAQAALLQLKVVDPACGTGAFLLAAARRIARRLDTIRKGSNAPRAIADVISNCLYGVDVGNITVQLCRLVLWFKCGPPYEPCDEIERHIQCGNSIFGAWPALLARGIPDVAYEAAESDDAICAKTHRLQNRNERGRKKRQILDIEVTEAHSLQPSPCVNFEMLADLWCSVFVWPKCPGGTIPTHSTLESLAKGEKALPEAVERTVRSLSERNRFFHWNLRFPEVFGEFGPSMQNPGVDSRGFDVVIGNPPWVAHAGRSTQKLPQGHKHFMLHCYPSFGGYPTTHGVFVEMATRIVGKRGRIGLVIPASVADLAGYAPTRSAHDERCVLLCPLPDYGEGRFTGVTQPCIGLVSQRVDEGRPVEDRGKPWQLNRQDLDNTAAALLTKWERMVALPAALFGERGFQSTPELRRHIRKMSEAEAPYTLAMREGSDVTEFVLGQPRLFADARALKGVLRASAEFAQVCLVVRQTARYPISAKSDGLAFRNSLLAVLSLESWPWPLMLCLLNSSLFRWSHYHRYRDGRQPILPQLKVGHLRSLPAPTSNDSAAYRKLEKIGRETALRNTGIQDAERAALDDCVGRLYELNQEEQSMVTRWHANRPR
jgi:hypothetical protein